MREERRGRTLLSTLLALAGCAEAPLPAATGGTTDVVVLVDTPGPPALEPLHSALAAPVPFVEPAEPYFLVEYRGVRGGSDFPREKNVIVVARNDSLGLLLPTLLPWLEAGERQRLARQGGCVVLADVWARDQVVTLLVGSDASGLDSLLRTEAASVRAQLLRSTLVRSGARLSALAATPLARQLRALGFRIAAPPAYRRVPAVEGVAAVELVAEAPTRIVTIFWCERVGVEMLRTESLSALQRDTMRRLHGDSLRVDSWRPEGEEGWVARGGWQNDSDVAGGPFLARFVYDPTRERLYGVQGQLFAPGRRKQPFLIELEALVETFRVPGEP